MITKYLCLLLLSSGLFFSCSKSDDPTPVTNNMDNPSPTNSETTTMGTFVSYAHNLSGQAILHIDSAGATVLRFENYTMSEGPDVHVYISKTNNFTAANVIEVTKLNTGFANNDVNFDFMSSVYTSEYKFVLVYCVKYSSLFGFTELK